MKSEILLWGLQQFKRAQLSEKIDWRKTWTSWIVLLEWNSRLSTLCCSLHFWEIETFTWLLIVKRHVEATYKSFISQTLTWFRSSLKTSFSWMELYGLNWMSGRTFTGEGENSISPFLIWAPSSNLKWLSFIFNRCKIGSDSIDYLTSRLKSGHNNLYYSIWLVITKDKRCHL